MTEIDTTHEDSQETEPENPVSDTQPPEAERHTTTFLQQWSALTHEVLEDLETVCTGGLTDEENQVLIDKWPSVS